MFKKLFAPKPKPADLLLNTIREWLVPLGFTESNIKRDVLRETVFQRGDVTIKWVVDIRLPEFDIYIHKGMERLERLDGTFVETPKEFFSVSMINSDVEEKREQILNAIEESLL